MQIFLRKEKPAEHSREFHHSHQTVVETSTCFSWPTFADWQEIKVRVELQQILNRLACALQSQLLNLFGPRESMFGMKGATFSSDTCWVLRECRPVVFWL